MAFKQGNFEVRNNGQVLINTASATGTHPALTIDPAWVTAIQTGGNIILTGSADIFVGGSVTATDAYLGGLTIVNNRITGLNLPVEDTDAVSKIYVDTVSNSLTGYVKRDGTTPLTNDWNAGAFSISANGFAIGSNKLEAQEFGYLDGQDQAVKTTDTPTFAGLTLNGNVDMNYNRITELATPVADSDAATKYYVDALIYGLNWQKPVINFANSPSTTGRYIVGPNPEGEFSAAVSNQIATFGSPSAGVWNFVTPEEGFAVWIQDLDELYVFNSVEWVKFGATQTHNNLSGLYGDPNYYHLSTIAYGFLQNQDQSVYTTSTPIFNGASLTGALNMNNNLINNVADPVEGTDAVNLRTLDNATNGLTGIYVKRDGSLELTGDWNANRTITVTGLNIGTLNGVLVANNGSVGGSGVLNDLLDVDMTPTPVAGDYLRFNGTHWTPTTVVSTDWSLSGNAIQAGEFLGTTNNLDLIIKTNNNVAATFTTNKELKLYGDLYINKNNTETNPNYKITQFTITTTDETPSIVATYNVPTNGCTYIEARIVAGTNTNNMGSFNLQSTYKNINGSSLNLVGTDYALINVDNDNWNAYITTNGTNISVVVVGTNTETIKWDVTIIVQTITIS